MGRAKEMAFDIVYPPIKSVVSYELNQTIMIKVNLQHPTKVLSSGYHDASKAFNDLQETIESSAIKSFTADDKKSALSEIKKLDNAFKLLQEARERFDGLKKEFEEKTSHLN